ncbi:hypothetical protein [Niveispirillum lacus]|uniref:hypothetical protein n=1 Tax=Niveispirillum lacus TaxID=1981099 RepID=UPI001A9C6014|nr:hypothetical protein [Niveispirillum lacus]
MRGPALLVFCHETEIAWLRCLRPGFRHVFIALPVAGGWITLDPLSTRLEAEYHPLPAGTDLAAWFRARGHQVLAASQSPPVPAQWPLAPFTCVTLVKRVLGIRAPWVQTPWQLYCHLGGPQSVPADKKECPILARLVSSPKPRTSAVAPNSPTPSPAPAPLVSAVQAVTAGKAAAPTAGEQSLLRRSAGRAGTVLTGWRGVLAPGALAPTRKTLLGE